jgi:hypothetical protein
MSLKSEAYKLIPPDMLHWNDLDGKFTFLTDEELTTIIENCIKAGAEEDEIIIFVRFMEQGRRNELLLKRMIDGDVTISFDETGEIVWKAV